MIVKDKRGGSWGKRGDIGQTQSPGLGKSGQSLAPCCAQSLVWVLPRKSVTSLQKPEVKGQVHWCMSVTPATWEAESGGSRVQVQG